MSSKDNRPGLTKPHGSRDASSKRTKVLKVRLSEQEDADLRAQARLQGQTMAECVRYGLYMYTKGALHSETVKRDQARRRKRDDAHTYTCDANALALANELKRLRIEHVRQGTNLNQMTRVLNTKNKNHLLNDKNVQDARRELQAAIVSNDAVLARIDELIDMCPDVMRKAGA